MKRFASFTFGVCSVVVFAGCAGDLSNPDDFADGGTAPQSAEMILAESCGIGGCHDDSLEPEAGLNLLSPDVAGRVVDQRAQTMGCTDRILVVAGDPDSSYLIDKVINAPAICGVKMPVLDDLTNDEIGILEDWIIDLGGGG